MEGDGCEISALQVIGFWWCFAMNCRGLISFFLWVC